MDHGLCIYMSEGSKTDSQPLQIIYQDPVPPPIQSEKEEKEKRKGKVPILYPVIAEDLNGSDSFFFYNQK